MIYEIFCESLLQRRLSAAACLMYKNKLYMYVLWL